MIHQTSRRPRISVVIPVCNEEESIAQLTAKLYELDCSLKRQYQVDYCFVDDGSTDGTVAAVGSAVPAGARYVVLSHAKNRGVGAAVRTAFAHVHADVVCTIDADCSYSPAELKGMIDMILRDEADIVVASPYHPQGGVRGVGQWRLLLSMNCSWLYRTCTPLKLHTYTSLFRAYRGSILRGLSFPSDGFVSTVEILLDAGRQGFRVREAPMVLRRRVTGVSKMRLVRTITTHVRLLRQCLVPGFAGRYPLLQAPAAAAVPATAVSGVLVKPVLSMRGAPLPLPMAAGEMSGRMSSRAGGTR